ncbi:hypothetical protein TREES_T100007260 [Tupaia chinensis]|uniref:Uncharacterized protein n=1 Tax=Tupaia chinensis TaxID=246437 RepID=L9L0Z9_TUPCH|nr:hypothetical protein TREES_T100007260 [Tupaia chinensis]
MGWSCGPGEVLAGGQQDTEQQPARGTSRFWALAVPAHALMMATHREAPPLDSTCSEKKPNFLQPSWAGSVAWWDWQLGPRKPLLVAPHLARPRLSPRCLGLRQSRGAAPGGLQPPQQGRKKVLDVEVQHEGQPPRTSKTLKTQRHGAHGPQHRTAQAAGFQRGSR